MNKNRSSVNEAVFDDRTRGIPAGRVLDPEEIAASGWSPINGSIPLPVLTLSRSILSGNAAAFLQFAKANNVLLAPHAKTPMIPELAQDLIDQGAWGTTVATTQQLSVMLKAGIRNLIFGSPPGGDTGCSHLAKIIHRFPDANIYVFLDSVEGVQALARALSSHSNSLKGLVEVGYGRTGARDIQRALAVRDAILETGGLIGLGGVACYEAAAVKSASDVRETLPHLFKLLSDVVEAVADKISADQNLMITAGGSLYFNEVVSALRSVVTRNPQSTVVLRSGSIFFSDDGPYHEAFSLMADRGDAIGGQIGAALSIWAEIISRPEDGLAIAGFGQREAPTDLGLPVIKSVFRAGRSVDVAGAMPTVAKLNDHHAFLVGGAIQSFQVGDVVEVGICHPCTTLQRWRAVFGIGDDHVIDKVYLTEFG